MTVEEIRAKADDLFARREKAYLDGRYGEAFRLSDLLNECWRQLHEAKKREAKS